MWHHSAPVVHYVSGCCVGNIVHLHCLWVQPQNGPTIEEVQHHGGALAASGFIIYFRIPPSSLDNCMGTDTSRNELLYVQCGDISIHIRRPWVLISRCFLF